MTTPLFDLTGKVALLTGSSKGMGKAMAEGLAEQGAKVVISSRKLEPCEAVADEINEKYGAGSAIAIACNIGYKEQLQQLVDTTRERLGPIDILVANAGVNPFYGPMSEIPDAAFDKVLSSNIKSNHWLCQMVAPDMIEKGGGRSEEHTSELQSRQYLVCRLLLEKKNNIYQPTPTHHKHGIHPEKTNHTLNPVTLLSRRQHHTHIHS